MAESDGTETQVVPQEVRSAPIVLEKHPVAESLRAELLKLATEGDPKHKGALTAEVLARIMRVAKTGRDVLVSLNISGSNLANLVRRRRGPMYTPWGGQDEMDEGLEEGVGQSGGPLAFSTPQENFGMTALRELIAGAQKHFGGTGKGSTKDLIEALVLARKEGLTDVAAELETQLGFKKAPVLALPAPAVAEPKPV
jgi:hypothetical protein